MMQEAEYAEAYGQEDEEGVDDPDYYEYDVDQVAGDQYV